MDGEEAELSFIDHPSNEISVGVTVTMSIMAEHFIQWESSKSTLLHSVDLYHIAL